MGFFSKLGDLRSIADEIYNSAAPEMRDKIYYNGSDGVFIAIDRLYMSYPKNLRKDYRNDLILCNSIYVDVWVRKHHSLIKEGFTDEYIIERLAEKYSFLPKDVIAKLCYTADDVIYKNEPDLKERDKKIEIVIRNEQENMNANKGKVFGTSDADYGLTPANPIFVKGFGADRWYLTRLRTSDNRPLKYSRNGSITVEGINGPVDEYSMLVGDNTVYGKIYVCNYGDTTSEKAPAGYTFVLNPEAGSESKQSELEIELANVIESTSSAPLGDREQAWNWAVGQYKRFKSMGVLDTRLQPLIINMVCNLTSEYTGHFYEFIEEICPYNRLVDICISLINIKSPEVLVNALLPCVNYAAFMDKNNTKNTRSFCGQIDELMYVLENGGDNIQKTDNNYALAILAFCMIDEKIIVDDKEKSDNNRSFKLSMLKIAEKLSPANCKIHAMIASLCGASDLGSAITESNLAIKYCIANDFETLTQIYDSLSLTYFAAGDKMAANCFYQIAMKFGKPELSSFVLNGTDSLYLLTDEDINVIAQKCGVSVGFSELGYKACSIIENM